MNKSTIIFIIIAIIIIVILFSLFSFYLGRSSNKQITGAAITTPKIEQEQNEPYVMSRECTITSECPNGGSPIAIDGTHYVAYSCVSGFCQKSDEQEIQCALTAECIRKFGQGYVCDLSNINFGKCIKSTIPNYCGNGVCQSLDGENEDTCPDDCR